MKTTHIILLTGAVTLALAGSVSSLQAQSSSPAYYDPPYSNAPVGAAPGRYYATPLSGKVYLGFDAGAAWQQDITIRDTIGDSDKVTFDTGARLDCQLGYNFTTNWAAELEVGLIISPVKNSAFLGTDFMEVDLVELPVMVNVIYTQPLGRHFSACAGGGVGGAFSHYENEFGETTSSESAFAFQGLAGIKYAIAGPGSDSQGNETQFKSDGTMTHSFLLALTGKF
jgi:opacity protein-like surface antigen